jgi:hypothetical protein
MSTLEGIVKIDSSSTGGRPLKQGLFFKVKFCHSGEIDFENGHKKIFSSFLVARSQTFLLKKSPYFCTKFQQDSK